MMVTFFRSSFPVAVEPDFKKTRLAQACSSDSSEPSAGVALGQEGLTQDTLSTQVKSDALLPASTVGASRPAKQKNEATFPPELGLLFGLGVLGAMNPVAITPITEAIETNFLVNFNMLDFAGMGVPRVSRSLQRGAEPYNPNQDPKAQEKQGLDRWLYIKRQQLGHANWPNLYEELLREIQAAPGALLVPTLALAAMPLASRFTHQPFGRRALLLSRQALDEQSHLVTHLAQASKKPTLSFSELMTAYYHNAMDASQPVHRKPLSLQLNLDKTEHYHTQYTLNEQDRLLLFQHRDRLPAWLANGLTPPPAAKPLQGRPPHELNIKASFQEVKTAWAEVMVRLADMDKAHGTGWKLLTTPPLKQEREQLVREQALLSQLLDQAVIQVNHETSPQKPNQYHQLRLTTGASVNAGEFILHADKFRDVLTQLYHQSSEPIQSQALSEKLAEKTQGMMTVKLLYSGLSLTAMCSWMWFLSHALQRGRAYPANRLIMEAGSEPIKSTEPIWNLNPLQLETLVAPEETATPSSASFPPPKRPSTPTINEPASSASVSKEAMATLTGEPQ